MKIRKVFLMSVNAGAEEEYIKRHNPIWPELAETHQLFTYAEIEDEDQWAAIASTEVCQKWWKHMAEIMPSQADCSPLSTPLREVFHLA